MHFGTARICVDAFYAVDVLLTLVVLVLVLVMCCIFVARLLLLLLLLLCLLMRTFVALNCIFMLGARPRLLPKQTKKQ